MTSRQRNNGQSNENDQIRRSKRPRRSSSLDHPTLPPIASRPHLPPAPNNHPQHPQQPTMVGPRGLINRTDYLRLLQASLASLGFPDIAATLEQQSGVVSQTPAAARVQQHIEKGEWDGALQSVAELVQTDTTNTPPRSRQLSFLLLEQKFLQCIRSGDSLNAIKCLRNELSPLGVNQDRLHALSRLLLQPSNEASNRVGSNGSSTKHQVVVDVNKEKEEEEVMEQEHRQQVMLALQHFLSPDHLLPPHRLEELIEQALTAQIDNCRLHNTHHPRLSLMQNYRVGQEQLPLHCAQVLEAHKSEVWHVAFSHAGTMLASCGRDSKVILWDVMDNNTIHNQLCLRRFLSGHTAPVLFVAWSPDDAQLLSSSQDSTVRLWSRDRGNCIRVFSHHCEPVLSVAWLRDSKTFVTAGQDRMMAVVSAATGGVLQSWRGPRMQDVVVLGDDDNYILASTHDRKICVYFRQQEQAQTHEQEQVPSTACAWKYRTQQDDTSQKDVSILEGEDLMAFSVSPCGRYLAANLRDSSLSVWDLGPSAPASITFPQYPKSRYYPPGRIEGTQGRFVVRSCVGGVGSKFIASGTEHGVVPVWQRETGELIGVLEGHEADTTVNAVAWNEKRPEMMASAGDDGTVRIWLAGRS